MVFNDAKTSDSAAGRCLSRWCSHSSHLNAHAHKFSHEQVSGWKHHQRAALCKSFIARTGSTQERIYTCCEKSSVLTLSNGASVDPFGKIANACLPRGDSECLHLNTLKNSFTHLMQLLYPLQIRILGFCAVCAVLLGSSAFLGQIWLRKITNFKSILIDNLCSIAFYCVVPYCAGLYYLSYYRIVSSNIAKVWGNAGSI